MSQFSGTKQYNQISTLSQFQQLKIKLKFPRKKPCLNSLCSKNKVLPVSILMVSNKIGLSQFTPVSIVMVSQKIKFSIYNLSQFLLIEGKSNFPIQSCLLVFKCSWWRIFHYTPVSILSVRMNFLSYKTIFAILKVF